MPNENENKFKELLGDLNYYNKLSGKGIFKHREQAVTHPDDCSCSDCKREALNLYFFGKGDYRG